MKRETKRWASLLLALLMAVTLAAPGFAAPGDEPEPPVYVPADGGTTVPGDDATTTSGDDGTSATVTTGDGFDDPETVDPTLPQLAAPTELSWGLSWYNSGQWTWDETTGTSTFIMGDWHCDECPGSISWSTEEPTTVDLKIYRVVDGVSALYWDFGYYSSGSSQYTGPVYQSFDGLLYRDDLTDGTYYFTVQAICFDGTTQNSEIVRSPDWTYTAPPQLATPTGLRWTEYGQMQFDRIADEAGMNCYEVAVYLKDDSYYDGWREVDCFNSYPMEDDDSWYPRLSQSTYDFYGPGLYAFRVRALSSDIAAATTGAWSDFSAWETFESYPELPQLPAPTELSWDLLWSNNGEWKYDETAGQSYFVQGKWIASALSGAMSWATEEPMTVQVKLYRVVNGVGELYEDLYGHHPGSEYSGKTYQSIDDLMYWEDLPEGTYYFTAQAIGDDNTTRDSEIVRSPDWTYTAPQAQLAVPAGLNWSQYGHMRFDRVADETVLKAYEVKLYIEDETASDGWRSLYTSPVYSHGNNPLWFQRLSAWVLDSYGAARYAFRVRAVSGDLKATRSSDWSALSAAQFFDSFPEPQPLPAPTDPVWRETGGKTYMSATMPETDAPMYREWAIYRRDDSAVANAGNPLSLDGWLCIRTTSSLAGDDLCFDTMFSNDMSGDFAFRVRAASNDTSISLTGEWSELSPALTRTSTVSPPATPTDLTWGIEWTRYGDGWRSKTRPGAAAWAVPTDITSPLRYYVSYYRVGESNPVLTSSRYLAPSMGVSHLCDSALLRAGLPSGTYFFTVQAATTSMYPVKSEIERSGNWTYVRPATMLASPTDLSWSIKGEMVWPGSASDGTRYDVEFFKKSEGCPANGRDLDGWAFWGNYTDCPCVPLSLHIDQSSDAGEYAFRVRAISSDITVTRSSDWSALSAPMAFDENGVPASAANAPQLPAPTELRWGTLWEFNWDTEQYDAKSAPGEVSWHIALSDDEAEQDVYYDVRIYRVGDTSDEVIFRTDWGDSVRDGSISLDQFRFGDYGSGTYYFTVQTCVDGSLVYRDSDVVRSENWTYAAPETRLAVPTNLGWTADGKLTYTMPSDALTYGVVRYLYIRDETAASGWRSLGYTWGGRNSGAVTENITWSVKYYGAGEYAFRVLAYPTDVTQKRPSVLSELSAPLRFNADGTVYGSYVPASGSDFPATASDLTLLPAAIESASEGLSVTISGARCANDILSVIGTVYGPAAVRGVFIAGHGFNAWTQESIDQCIADTVSIFKDSNWKPNGTPTFQMGPGMTLNENLYGKTLHILLVFVDDKLDAAGWCVVTVTAPAAPTVLPAPTELSWGTLWEKDWQTGAYTEQILPGAISWHYVRPDGAGENVGYRLNIYRVGETSDECIFSTGWSSNDAAGYLSSEQFLFGDYPSGIYYFTVQATLNGNAAFLDSEVVRSENWTYTAPEAQLPLPTNIGWTADGKISYIAPNDYDLLGIVRYLYIRDDAAPDGWRQLGYTWSECAPGSVLAESISRTVKSRGAGEYAFRVLAYSADITQTRSSVLSELSAPLRFNADGTVYGSYIPASGSDFPATASDLPAPTELSWGTYWEVDEQTGEYAAKNVPGYASWHYAMPDDADVEISYYLCYYRVEGTSERLVYEATWTMGESEGYINDEQFLIDDFLSGTYYFTVQAIADGSAFYRNSYPVRSAEWTYTAPSARMSVPTDFRWTDDGKIACTAPSDALLQGIIWCLYKRNASAADGWEEIGCTWYPAQPGITYESEIVNLVRSSGAGEYAFRVLAYSADITQTRSSVLSELSAPLRFNADGTVYGSNPSSGSDIPASGSDLTKLAAPTDLIWLPSGAISFKPERPTQYSYRIAYYRVDPDGGADERVEQLTLRFSAQNTPEYAHGEFFKWADRPSGTYYFTVQALGDGKNYQNSDIIRSANWEYTAPTQKLATPTSLGWTPDGKMSFAPISADGLPYNYQWELFVRDENMTGRDGIPDGWRKVGSSAYAMPGATPEANWTAEINERSLESGGSGLYVFRVHAISLDIATVRTGEWSALSAPRYFGESSGAAEILNETLESIDDVQADSAPEQVAEAIATATAALETIGTEALKENLLTDQTGESATQQLIEKVEALQDSKAEATVAMEEPAATASAEEKEAYALFTEIAQGTDVVGAGLNAEQGQKVELQIDKPDATTAHVIPAQYSNTVQIKLDLVATDAVSGQKETITQDHQELAVPVKIKMPVPAGINPAFLVILHHHADGTVKEILRPHIIYENGKAYASFVVTSFSDFTFAQADITAERSAEGVAVRVVLPPDAQVDTIYCAVYSAAGKMLGVSSPAAVVDGKAETSVECVPAEAATVKVFFLGADKTPLCPAKEYALK